MIYQIVDSTSDEMYFTLATFNDFDTAKNALLARANPYCAVSDSGDEDDYEKLVIYEYAIGWSAEKKVVYTLERNKKYNELTDQFEWVNACV